MEWRIFEAGGAGQLSDLDLLRGHEWIVNSIGITKPLIHDDTAADVERALQVNAVLPYRIAALAATIGARMIQIATDCAPPVTFTPTSPKIRRGRLRGGRGGHDRTWG